MTSPGTKAQSDTTTGQRGIDGWGVWVALGGACVLLTVRHFLFSRFLCTGSPSANVFLVATLHGAITFLAAYAAYELWKPRLLLDQELDEANKKNKVLRNALPRADDANHALAHFEQRTANNWIEHAELALERGRAVLTRGLFYVQAGGFLFLVSLVVLFTAMSYADGSLAIWWVGVIALGIVFLFLEAIGFWYLQQHRYYVQTATMFYKSLVVTDRFLLCALIKDSSPAGAIAAAFIARNVEDLSVENENVAAQLARAIAQMKG